MNNKQDSTQYNVRMYLWLKIDNGKEGGRCIAMIPIDYYSKTIGNTWCWIII